MKKLILLILVLISLDAFAPAVKRVPLLLSESTNPYTNLYNASCSVESAKNANAVNYEEQAYGIVQIRQGKLTDFNLETLHNYTLRDCLNPDISYEVWMYFAGKYDYRDSETIAKRWNGSGRKNIEYWNKVKVLI